MKGIKTLWVRVSLLLLIFVFALNVWGQEEKTFSFVVVSDLHIGEKNGAEKFKFFLKQIEAIKPPPDFIVITGDIHAEPFAKVYNEIKPKYRFYVAFGNHEKKGDRDLLTQLLNLPTSSQDFYAFVHKGVKFIFLCTASNFGDHVGHFESEGIRGSTNKNGSRMS